MKFFFICLMFSYVCVGYSQSIEQKTADTNSVMQLIKTANRYNFSKADSGLMLSEQALEMARKLHFKKGEIAALHTCGESFQMLGDFPQSLKIQFEALEMDREMKDKAREAETLGYIGNLYIQLGEYREALQYLISENKIAQEIANLAECTFALSNIGDVYDFLKMPDSALYYQKKAYEHFSDLLRPHLQSFILRHMGNIYAEFKKNDSALKFFNATILNSNLSNDRINMSMAQKKMSDVYSSMHEYDSSLYYAHEAFMNAQIANVKSQLLDASELLASWYRKANNPDSAFFYMDIASAVKDSLYGPEKVRQLQLLMLQEQEKQQITKQQEEALRNRIKYISLLAALGVLLLFIFILFRNNRHKHDANKLLSSEKAKVEQTLTGLKSAQAQLIQREKMASLGELTTGIAHEIQNPLNFVNNFSDVNKELLAEMNEEIDKENFGEVKAIAKDVIENEQKINHHGKRADAIVKGMLQHSRSSTGVKEPSNINALADEYLRLAYHGFRAKDKEFNATMKTDFDVGIDKINIVPQDIGRVLLNLYNNAFYAVNEKKKTADTNYEPTVSVVTKKSGNQVSISVSDNGNGIPQKVVDKIFQPFFTTKPTGQATGLGLSLSYDIVKAHGGEIKVETKEGNGSEFIIIIQ